MERSEKTDVVGTRMGRIMLRFRPIAPKPVGPSGGSSSSTGPPVVEYDSSSSSSGRRRRGNNNNNKGGSRGRKKRVSMSNIINVERNDDIISVSPRPLTLLSLMPPQLNHKTSQLLIDPIPSSSNTHLGNIVATSCRKTLTTTRTTTSNVVVESVVGFVDDPCHLLSWCKEEEAIRWLENEMSPAFISSGFVRVRWTNTAYRRMVEKEMPMPMPMPMVVEISKSPRLSEQVIITGNAFTCRVKVINYNSQRERGSFASLCDTWRLLDGLFAWRIDVDAALSLGR